MSGAASFRLRAGNPETVARRCLFLLATVAAYCLFSFYGNDSAKEGVSVFSWVAMHWRLDAHDFGAIPWTMLAVGALVTWRERGALAAAPVSPSWRGVAMVAIGLLLHVAGYRSQLARLSLAACVAVFWGIPWAIWGGEVARLLRFSAAYALLCLCGSILVDLTMPLRLLSSALAAFLLKGIGIAASCDGTVVYSAAGGGFQFDVADACSGLRSLITMTALAAPYAYFTMGTTGKRLLLFALSVPLAMVANALRIFTLGVVAEWIGMRLAMQLYHDLSGYIVFFLSIMLLMAAGTAINQDWGARLCSLKQRRRYRV